MKNPLAHLLIFLLPIIGFTQSDKIYFQEYSIKDGLPEEYVTTMIQDDQGFIWFTTQNGLVRYDGYEFEVFGVNHQDPMAGTLQLAITAGGMVKGKHDRYWIGSDFFGGSPSLAMYDGKTNLFENWLFKKEDDSSSDFLSFRPLFEDSRSNLWFLNHAYSVDSTRLGRFHTAADSFYYYPVDQNARNFFINNARIGNYHLYESPESQKIWFIGHEPGILYQWDPIIDSFMVALKPGDPSLNSKDTLKTLFPMQDDRVILVSDHSLYIWNSDTEKIEQSYHHDPPDGNSLLDSTIVVSIQDYYGKIWVTHHRQGFSIINPETETVEQLPYGTGKLSGEGWPQNGQSPFPTAIDSSGIWFVNNPSNTLIYFNTVTKGLPFLTEALILFLSQSQEIRSPEVFLKITLA